MLDFLVHISRRVAYNYYVSILVEARFLISAGRIALRAIRFLEESYIPKAFIRLLKSMLIWS